MRTSISPLAFLEIHLVPLETERDTNTPSQTTEKSVTVDIYYDKIITHSTNYIDSLFINKNMRLDEIQDSLTSHYKSFFCAGDSVSKLNVTVVNALDARIEALMGVAYTFSDTSCWRIVSFSNARFLKK